MTEEGANNAPLTVRMFIGQAVRSRLQPDLFRRWFQITMILLGFYLAGSTILNIHG